MVAGSVGAPRARATRSCSAPRASTEPSRRRRGRRRRVLEEVRAADCRHCHGPPRGALPRDGISAQPLQPDSAARPGAGARAAGCDTAQTPGGPARCRALPSRRECGGRLAAQAPHARRLCARAPLALVLALAGGGGSPEQSTYLVLVEDALQGRAAGGARVSRPTRARSLGRRTRCTERAGRPVFTARPGRAARRGAAAALTLFSSQQSAAATAANAAAARPRASVADILSFLCGWWCEAGVYVKGRSLCGCGDRGAPPEQERVSPCKHRQRPGEWP